MLETDLKIWGVNRGTSRASYVNASKCEEEELGEQERPGSSWCLHLYRDEGTTTRVEKDGGVYGDSSSTFPTPKGLP